ncbi:MAG: galactokinase [Ardenticatenaceae bacterium]|nr:galactokinase [Anaerolineales bacterium]MCB8923843.1 galactokinase [Ardenticatenaceae bacterium]MCB9003378.1 galactokinase [Ardenticatenaceae bacterium]
MTLPDQIIQAFTERYGASPTFLARGPGRVNLIGEHTDYNDGFVMPIAIDRALWIALRVRDDEQIAITSLDMGETAVFPLANLQPSQPAWLEYVKGVAWAMQSRGYSLRGWEGVMAGDIPIGAGLSSSAALEMAAVRAFAAVSRLDLPLAEMARLGQKAENEWVGVHTGIMDQMISAAGEKGHALLIDCRTLETEAVPLPQGTAVAVLDTNTRRGLVESAYNERRQQCETAAAHFGVSALRDVDWEMFRALGETLDDIIYRRARHVVTENGRVLQAKTAMQQGNAAALGQLLNASHHSLRDDFEVSSPALDTIVKLAQNHTACYGARMTGAGFGGCAVALINTDADTRDFVRQVSTAYQAQMQLTPAIFICRAMPGASLSIL